MVNKRFDRTKNLGYVKPRFDFLTKEYLYPNELFYVQMISDSEELDHLLDQRKMSKCKKALNTWNCSMNFSAFVYRGFERASF